MADQHERRAQADELALQPLDRRQVEMVGRLVEQQDVGLGRQRPRQRGAARLAAGQPSRVLLAGQAQLAPAGSARGADRRPAPSPAST